jgi:hypothetical protein
VTWVDCLEKESFGSSFARRCWARLAYRCSCYTSESESAVRRTAETGPVLAKGCMRVVCSAALNHGLGRLSAAI